MSATFKSNDAIIEWICDCSLKIMYRHGIGHQNITQNHKPLIASKCHCFNKHPSNEKYVLEQQQENIAVSLQ
jgi:hypothetical protein